jgi:hypothetical protein
MRQTPRFRLRVRIQTSEMPKMWAQNSQKISAKKQEKMAKDIPGPVQA